MSVASLAEHQRDLQFTYINNDRQQQRQAAGSSIRQQACVGCVARGMGRGAYEASFGDAGGGLVAANSRRQCRCQSRRPTCNAN